MPRNPRPHCMEERSSVRWSSPTAHCREDLQPRHRLLVVPVAAVWRNRASLPVPALTAEVG